MAGPFQNPFGTPALTPESIERALGYTPEDPANKGEINGYASLDGTGKILVAELPASITGAVNFVGTWDAATNTPTLGNSGAGGVKGDYLVVNNGGTTSIDGINVWDPTDWIVNNGTIWEKIDNTNQVVSVFGRAGAIVAADNDYTAGQITGLPVTIGPSGADFTTFKASSDAGNNNHLIIGNVSETTNATLSTGNHNIVINPGADWNLGAAQIAHGEVNQTLNIEGMAGSSITYAIAATYSPFDAGAFSVGSAIKFRNLTVNNNSTSNGPNIANVSSQIYNDIIFNLPNFSDAGIDFASSETSKPLNAATNVTFVGGGTSCKNVMTASVVGTTSYYANIKFKGVFEDGGRIINISTQCIINGLDFSSIPTATASYSTVLRGTITNIIGPDSDQLDIELPSAKTTLSNVSIISGDIFVTVTLDRILITNCTIGGKFDLDLVAGTEPGEILISNSACGSIDSAGDFNSFSNMIVDGDINISGDHNGVHHCRVGPKGGGTGRTIIIAGSANGTSVANCHTDAAIEDNGSGTLERHPFVY